MSPANENLSELIEEDTQSDHQLQPGRVVTITLTRSQQQRRRANKGEEEEVEEVVTTMKQIPATEAGGRAKESGKGDANGEPEEAVAGEADSITISKSSSQRKTWQTSPEEVEELTRSLSRLRTTDEHGGGYLYEKMVEKEKQSKSTSNRRHNPISKKQQTEVGQTVNGKAVTKQTSTSIDQPHLVNGGHQQEYDYVVKMTTTSNGHHQQKAESFLPPLTGFSDTDSSFGSFSCSVDGEHNHSMQQDQHQLPTTSTDHRHVQCICESLKKSKLEEHENFGAADDAENGNGNIKFIDVEDNWIVSRPRRAKPRDNLRLEGPMEMETTFRSTYETTAQRMNRADSGETEDRSRKASKRSTATTSRSGGSKGSPSSLYLNTRRGRNGGLATPLLRSAKSRRRHTRYRPMTSLKAGGDGYYNTISGDAYKNFIIVNGEAKTIGAAGPPGEAVSAHVKLPKVVSKTTLTTSEEKNRQKYMKSGKSKGGESSKGGKNGDAEKMVMIGGEQIRKFEKKSYIAKSDGAEEVTDVERKMVRKMKCPPKDRNIEDQQYHSEGADDDGEKMATDANGEQMKPNYTIENISGAPKRPYHARYQDNIREQGLLDRSDEAMAAGAAFDKSKADAYRHTMRRLHETSKDFNLRMESPVAAERAPGRQLPKTRPEVKVKLQSESEQAKEAAAASSSKKVINGSHVMGKPSQKPFILPQRIMRHKNDCSVNVFEGDMDFTTTSRWAYGDKADRGRKHTVRTPGSAQRKLTAGRRSLKSSKRRNLFRQSSDSMFSTPGQETAAGKESAMAASKSHAAAELHDHSPKITSTYKKNFDDRLYCPALDVNNHTSSENFKYTGEAGGHKYYLSSNYS